MAHAAPNGLGRGVPPVLHERNFRLLLTGQAISIIGDAISMIALPFAILAMGGSVAQVGLVLGARAVPNAVFLLIGGVWADRLPRRLVMLASDLVRGVTMVAIFIVLVSDHGSIVLLVLLSAVYGIGEAFFRPALSGVIPQCVSPARLQEAYGLLATTPALGIAVGGAVGGALVALISPAGAIAFDAASFGVSAACLALMRTQGSPTPWKNRDFRYDLREGWTAFSSRRWLVVVVIGEVLYALFVMPSIYAVGPAIADEKLGGSSSWAAIVSGFGIGFLIGGLTAMKLRPQRPLVLGYLLCIPFAFFFVALALSPPVFVLAAAAIVAGSVISMSGTLLETTITREVPPELRSRVGSFRTLGSVAMLPVGMILVGPITGAFTTTGAEVIAFIAVLANVAIVLGTPSVRALRAHYPAEQPPTREPGDDPLEGVPRAETVV
ncbi:MAG: MFS transporter [Gaiellales bacterium]